MAAALLALHSALAAHPESAWDERVDPACCPYPEHDPRESMWKAAAQRPLSIQHAPPQRQIKLEVASRLGRSRPISRFALAGQLYGSCFPPRRDYNWPYSHFQYSEVT